MDKPFYSVNLHVSAINPILCKTVRPVMTIFSFPQFLPQCSSLWKAPQLPDPVKQSRTLWSLPHPPSPQPCFCLRKKLKPKNKFNQRSKKMQKQRKPKRPKNESLLTRQRQGPLVPSQGS